MKLQILSPGTVAARNRTPWGAAGRMVLGLGAVSLALAACAHNQQSERLSYLNGASTIAGRDGDATSYWDGESAKGTPSITISLHEQKAYFFKGGVLVGVSAISTGREGHGTSPGIFKITQLDKGHASNLYGDYADANGTVVKANVSVGIDPLPVGAHFVGASMPYFMRFDQGTGLHAGFLPGYPASHGCIRMPKAMAEEFFHSVAIGTPVTVKA